MMTMTEKEKGKEDTIRNTTEIGIGIIKERGAEVEIETEIDITKLREDIGLGQGKFKEFNSFEILTKSNREDRHRSRRHKERRRRRSSDDDQSVERYYNRIIERVKQQIPTKFSAGPDPRFDSKYLTPQEKLEEYKRENPNVNTTVHNKTDRQLYVGNLPPEISIAELCKHLNDALYALNLCEQEDKPIVDAWISGDGHYAFVEFRTIREAHLGFNLTQISIHGHALKVGKPRIANSSYHLLQQQMSQMKDNTYEDVVKVNNQPTGGYVNPAAMAQSSAAINNQFDNILKSLPGPPPPQTVGGAMAGMGQPPAMSNPTSFKSKVVTIIKLKVSNLPIEYNEDQVREILKVCGEVKELEMIKDENTGKYKGEIYVQYENEEQSRSAEAILMGMKIRDAFLHVKKVQTTTTLHSDNLDGPGSLIPKGEDFRRLWNEEADPSTCLALSNLLVPEQITDVIEYADVEDEVFEEMEQYGKALQVVAPRPSKLWRPGMPLDFGVGMVYVRFETHKNAVDAKNAMLGRRFEGRTIQATIFTE